MPTRQVQLFQLLAKIIDFIGEFTIVDLFIRNLELVSFKLIACDSLLKISDAGSVFNY